MIREDRKKNTMLVKGVSNSGKTKFLERLKEIFYTEDYIQQYGSHFDIDYTKNATYDYTKYKP